MVDRRALRLAWLLLLGWPLASAAAPIPWDSRAQGAFVMSLAADTRGRVWAGTEDAGVWRYDPGAKPKPWTQFTTRQGLGDDNAYALCVDAAGRVWAGQRSHGVAVCNGRTWRTYDCLRGPLGERVSGLAPGANGDVWLATSCGLTRWCAATDTWRTFTTADGLPSNQFTCVAVDPQGTVYAGTACDGLASGRASDGYATWRAVPGPWELPRNAGARGALRLPNGLLNALALGPGGSVYAATVFGLARSGDGGRVWDSSRGREWIERVRQCSAAPRDFQSKFVGPLAEDYLSALAFDADGRLWLGYRRSGVCCYEGANLVFELKPDRQPLDPVQAILPRRGAPPLVAFYGGGLRELTGAPAPKAGETAPAETDPPAWPSPAAPPDAAELAVLTARVRRFDRPLAPGGGELLGEDWSTAGDWCGRYGRADATLCAVQAPLDHVFGFGGAYQTTGRIGPHRSRDDSLRYWVHWLRTQEPRTLWNPLLGYRRQADWDDYGEAYSPDWEGPDVWAELKLPAGVHRVSLYFFNKDGHDGPNRWRDYLVQLKPYRADPRSADLVTPLASARVKDFWGPKYVQFVVRGPGQCAVRVLRNYSFNTILQGVFVDKLDGPPGLEDRLPAAGLGNLRYGPAEREAAGLEPPAPPCRGPWGELWAELDRACGCQGGASLQRPYRLLAYRAALAAGEPEALPARWRWRLPLWTPADRAEHLRTMGQA